MLNEPITWFNTCARTQKAAYVMKRVPGSGRTSRARGRARSYLGNELVEGDAVPLVLEDQCDGSDRPQVGEQEPPSRFEITVLLPTLEERELLVPAEPPGGADLAQVVVHTRVSRPTSKLRVSVM